MRRQGTNATYDFGEGAAAHVLGDEVVHPQHGVGEIVKLENREFERGKKRRYYEIDIPGGSTVWVPVDLSNSGLRKLAQRSELARCREILRAQPATLTTDGRIRQSELVAHLNRGTIAADPFLRTNFPNIFCAGDVAGPYQFTHTAGHQAWYAAVNALFGQIKKFRVDYSVIPWCTFTDPEVARVGLIEAEARQQNVPHEVARFELSELDRAIAEGEEAGWVKVLTPPGKDKILGVTIVGAHAGDLLAEFVLAMKHGIGLNKILGTIHAYPTLAEANKMAAGAWKRAHVPEKLLGWVERYHAWRRG